MSGGDEALERESWSCGWIWAFVLIRWKEMGAEKERLDGLEMGLEKKERGFWVMNRTAEEREVAMAMPWCRERERGVRREMDERWRRGERPQENSPLDILHNEPQ